MEKETRNSISRSISEMSVEDCLSFPLNKLLSVRVIACNIGTVNGRRFKTRTDRENGCVYVTRVS